MRSGHYNLTRSKNGENDPRKLSSLGQFKTSCLDLPPISTIGLKPDSNLRKSKIPIKKSRLPIKQESVTKEIPRKTSPTNKNVYHQSCEDVSLLSAKMHVEDRNHSAKSKILERPELSQFDTDTWKAGKIITRKPRITAAHSHSALHTLGGSSDTVSCVSASSGYSSSNSSSCGSFKSCRSGNSTLQRQHTSHGVDSSGVLFVDNPLYDVTPPRHHHYDTTSRNYEHSVMESLSSGEFSLGEEANLYEELEEDPVAKECRKYFEKRVQTSESLRKRWSLRSKPNFSSCSDNSDLSNSSDLDLISKGDAVVDSRLNPDLPSSLDSGVGFESSVMVEQNLGFCQNNSTNSGRKKTHLDQKMEFLRQEIACLMQQDNTLFKQLLALNDSIATLKGNRQRSSGHVYVEQGQQNLLEGNSRSPSPPSEHNGSDEEPQSPRIEPFQCPSTRDSTSSSRDLNNSSNASFMRCRKSYAPTARNRRRSSSVTGPRLQCSGTTALVVAHPDEDLSFLNLGSASSGFTMTRTFSHGSRAQTSSSKVISIQRPSKRDIHHLPYREALIM